MSKSLNPIRLTIKFVDLIAFFGHLPSVQLNPRHVTTKGFMPWRLLLVRRHAKYAVLVGVELVYIHEYVRHNASFN